MEHMKLNEIPILVEEKRLIRVCFPVYMLSLFGLLYAFLTQPDIIFPDDLIPDRLLFSDYVSLICESTALFAFSGLIYVFYQALERIIDYDRVLSARFFLMASVLCVPFYVLSAKIGTMWFGTAGLPGALDLFSNILIVIFLFSTLNSLCILYLSTEEKLRVLSQRALLCYVGMLVLGLCFFLLALTSVPNLLLASIAVVQLVLAALVFKSLYAMLGYSPYEEELKRRTASCE